LDLFRPLCFLENKAKYQHKHHIQCVASVREEMQAWDTGDKGVLGLSWGWPMSTRVPSREHLSHLLDDRS